MCKGSEGVWVVRVCVVSVFVCVCGSGECVWV